MIDLTGRIGRIGPDQRRDQRSRRSRHSPTIGSAVTSRQAVIATFSSLSPLRDVHTFAMGHLPRRGPEVVLPFAIARPIEAAEYRTAMRGSLNRWATQRWRFVAPRLVPAVLALIGMLGVLAAMDLMASRCRFSPRPATVVYLVSDLVSDARSNAPDVMAQNLSHSSARHQRSHSVGERAVEFIGLGAGNMNLVSR